MSEGSRITGQSIAAELMNVERIYTQPELMRVPILTRLGGVSLSIN